MLFRSLVPCAVLLCLGVPAVAQSADAVVRGDAREGIVVTGRGLDVPPSAAAYDSTVLTRERLGTTGSGRIEDALAGVAGFQQFRRSDSRSANPSAQGVTLRALGGNATSRTLVLLDGVPLADPFFGYVPLSAIDPALLAGARVNRGGGSGAFGAGAVAGTIALASAGPADLGRVRGSALIADRAETDLSASVAPYLGSGFAVVSGQWQRGRGFWTTPPAQRVRASVRASYESWSGGVRAVVPLADGVELQSRLAAFADRRTLRFAGADTTSAGQDASVRIVGRGAWAFEAMAYVQARDFSNVVISSGTFRKVLDQFSTPSTGWGGKLELRPAVHDAHVLRVGADWRVASGTARETAFNATSGAVTARRSAGGRNSDLGLYVEDDWTLGPVVLTAGLRADRWSMADGLNRDMDGAGVVKETPAAPRSGWDLTARGGALVRLAPGVAVRGSAYGGIRQPTLNELYRTFTVTATAPGGSTVTTRTEANATLANERLEGFEAGLDLAPVAGVTVSATLFDNRVHHAIANVTINQTATFVSRQRRNVDAVQARGVELGASIRSGRWAADLSWAWTDARVRAGGAAAQLNGMRPAQAPNVAASGTLAWATPRGVRAAVTVRHVGAQFEDDLQSDVLPAVTTLDAHLQMPLGRRARLVVRGENLANVTVMTRNQAGSIDLGVPRTIWAGVQVAFP